MRTAAAMLIPLVACTAPAAALEIPDGSKNPDHRVCDVAYNPNDIVDARGVVGETLTIHFRSNERIGDVATSDAAHLKWSLTKGSNTLWLKATMAMPTQPLSIRTLQQDGTPRDYALQWSATDPTQGPPHVAVAATGGAVNVAEVTPDTKYCYVIQYQYPADEKAARDAADRAAWIKKKNEAAEIALRQQQMMVTHNVRYVAQGDASIGPTEIFDDGNTTELHFPGNMRLPVILTVTPDGHESQVTGISTEDNGVVKLHGVWPTLRLRDGQLVLCIFNRGFNPIGNNPGTGTSSPDIGRQVNSPR